MGGGSGREVEVVDEGLVLVQEVDKERILVDEGEGNGCKLLNKGDDVEIVGVVEVIVEEVIVIVLSDEGIEIGVSGKKGEDLGIISNAAKGTGDGKSGVEVLGDFGGVERVGLGAVVDNELGEVGEGREGGLGLEGEETEEVNRLGLEVEEKIVVVGEEGEEVGVDGDEIDDVIEIRLIEEVGDKVDKLVVVREQVLVDILAVVVVGGDVVGISSSGVDGVVLANKRF